MPTDLSPKQAEALELCRKHGSLERREGGFWTYPGCLDTHQQPLARGGMIGVPGWYVPVGAIAVLVRRGFVYITKRDETRNMETEVKPVEVASGRKS